VLGGDRVAQRGQRGAHLGPQALGLRGRLQALRRAREQLVAHGFAQPAQRLADAGLSRRQCAGGARCAAFGHHRVEHPQQVQVDGAEVGHGRTSLIFVYVIFDIT